MFALFDSRVSNEKKKAMVENLDKNEPAIETTNNRPVITKEDISSLELEQFVCSKSTKFFEIVQVDSSFLEDPVSSWKFDTNRNYQKAASDICALTVVNDPAERAVALVKFLKSHNFKPKTAEEFQQQLITIDTERSRHRITQDDQQLLDWYLSLPILDEAEETEEC